MSVCVARTLTDSLGTVTEFIISSMCSSIVSHVTVCSLISSCCFMLPTWTSFIISQSGTGFEEELDVKCESVERDEE